MSRGHASSSELISSTTRSITRELPLNVPFAAKSGLIKAAIREWEQLSLEAFAKIRPQVERIIKDLVADYFGRFTGGSLPATVT